jgi:hypothetical protein
MQEEGPVAQVVGMQEKTMRLRELLNALLNAGAITQAEFDARYGPSLRIEFHRRSACG